MRSISRRLTAAGASAWIVLDRNKRNFGVGLSFVPSSGSTLTGAVQHTFDDFYSKSGVTIARVTTTATVTKVNHGLSVADYVIVEGAGAPLDGEFAVAAITDADNFTYTVVDSGVTSAPRARIGTARVFDHETMVSMTTRTDGNYALPAAACRLKLTAYTIGFADLVVIQQG